MSSTPLITLTTDFGVNDHFVGTMKGVILGIAPKARMVDITHGIAPFQVAEAAFEIEQAWRFFPRGSVHAVVVDPGVGSDRRPILVSAGGHYFVGPDNGVFSLIYREKHAVREMTNVKFRLAHVSRTFHGRDIFAPAAAHLALGAKPAQFGKLVKDAHTLAALEPVKLARSWRGIVIKADRFGNLVTNFHVHQFPDVKTSPIELRIAGRKLRRFALTYSDATPGELVVLVGSSGYLEISANQGSAAQMLSARAHTPLEIEFV